jgi:ribosomal protein S18 acetylase RimI-like enzyme
MVTIREAGPADHGAVAGLHVASWRVAYRGILRDAYLDGDLPADRDRVWRERFGWPPARRPLILLAEDGGVALGFIGLLLDQDPVWGSLIDNLHVLPDRRGGGIGARLMRAGAARLAALRPRDRVHLSVFADNRPARAVYEHWGGVQIDSAEEEVPGGGRAVAVRYGWASPLVLSGI